MTGARFRITLLAALLAALALAAGGCGGDGRQEPAAAQWADSVCTALGGWRTSLAGLAQFEGTPTSEAIEERIEEAERATEELVEDLRAIGAPDTPQGRGAKEAIEDLAGSIEDEVNSLRDQVRELSGTQSVEELVQRLTKLGPAVLGLFAEVQATIQRVGELEPVGELKDAIEGSEACRSLLGRA